MSNFGFGEVADAELSPDVPRLSKLAEKAKIAADIKVFRKRGGRIKKIKDSARAGDYVAFSKRKK